MIIYVTPLFFKNMNTFKRPVVELFDEMFGKKISALWGGRR